MLFRPTAGIVKKAGSRALIDVSKYTDQLQPHGKGLGTRSYHQTQIAPLFS
jgi:hypothetical protein